MQKEFGISKLENGMFRCNGCGRVHRTEIEAQFCGCGYD